MELKTLSKYLVYLSIVTVVLAGYGAFWGSDLWLAPTQWLAVTTALVAYAIYLKNEKD